jgi:inosine-uridine nucleoside N-ribohydrolase
MVFPHRCVETQCSVQHVVFAIVLAFWGALTSHAQEKTADRAIETADRVVLSAGQTRAISLLNQARPDKPAPLFLFTDPNKDPDDLSVLVQAKYLQEHGFVDLRCVLTTLGDRDVRHARARFARSVLDDLGLKHVQVGVGVDYGFKVKDATGAVDTKATEGRRKDHRVFIETPILRPFAVVELDGLALLKRELKRVPDHSAVLLINCGMADTAALLRDAPELVKQKTAKVVIMGGVEPQVDQRGFVVADKRAYNNSTHQPSADYTYARVQQLGVPLVVVNKEATYTAAVPRSFYDGMAATKHPIGIYLRDQQKQSLKHLWEGIHSGRLPPALTPEWFFQTFSDLDINSASGKAAVAQAEAHADDFEGVWKQVSKFNLYDPLALMAATPSAGELVFRGDVPARASRKVQIVGKDSIKDPTLLQELLAGLAIESLNPPLGTAKKQFPILVK